MFSKVNFFYSNQEQLTDPDAFVKAQTAKYSSGSSEQAKAAPTEFKLKRSDSITSVNSYFSYKSTTSSSTSESNASKLFNSLTSNYTSKEVNFDIIYLRLCCDCGKQLEKKYKFFKEKIIQPEFANLYDV